MTDKEQIEEIKKIIDERCEAELGQVHASSKDGKVIKTVDTSLIAKDINNAGYRKVNEKLLPYIGKGVETIRKETAKEVGQKIYKILEGNFNGGILLFIKDTINGVLEKHGVEIEKNDLCK